MNTKEAYNLLFCMYGSLEHKSRIKYGDNYLLNEILDGLDSGFVLSKKQLDSIKYYMDHHEKEIIINRVSISNKEAKGKMITFIVIVVMIIVLILLFSKGFGTFAIPVSALLIIIVFMNIGKTNIGKLLDPANEDSYKIAQLSKFKEIKLRWDRMYNSKYKET